MSTDQIKCPRCHELATSRLLQPSDREMMTKVVGDVFEIACHHCGRYEFKLPDYGSPTSHGWTVGFSRPFTTHENPTTGRVSSSVKTIFST
jgi:hypothetical protein